MDFPPMVGTAHPGYPPQDVAMIRAWLDSGHDPHMVLPPSDRLAVVVGCDVADHLPDQPRTRLLSRLVALTPAPWARLRFSYAYHVAMDDLGRCVASERVYREYEPEPMPVLGRQGGDHAGS